MLMYTMTTTLLIYFYTNVVGISAGAVGMIMLISVYSMVSRTYLWEPSLTGHIPSMEKARIWILRLAVPYALAAVLLFTMPPMGNMGKIIYAFVTYNIMNTVVYTAISQPFHAHPDNYDRLIHKIRFYAFVTYNIMNTVV